MAADVFTRQHWTEWFDKDLFHMCYWPKYVASQRDWVNADIDAIVDDLVQAGIKVMNWGGPENWFPIDTDMLDRHPALNDRMNLQGEDFFDRLIARCHEEGIRFVIGFSGKAGRESKTRFINDNWDAFQKQAGYWEGFEFRGHEVCLFNDTFVEAHLASVKALCERYPVDGVVIDTPVHRVPVDEATGEIKCAYCREAWRQRSGMDEAPARDWDDPKWNDFIAWQNSIVVPHLAKMRETIKGVDEKLFITANMIVRPADSAESGTPNPADMRGVLDSLCHESIFLVYNTLDVQMNLKHARASTGSAPGCILKNYELIAVGGYPHGRPSAVETETLACLSLAHGSWVSIHSTLAEDGMPHRERTDTYIDVCKKLKPHLPYFEKSAPEATVGLVYSRVTRDEYAGQNPPSYLASLEGAEQMLTYNHIPAQYLLDEDLTLEKLAPLKAVVLPNVACLSDSAVSALRAYVEQGGALVASYETSLYDEKETFRGDFGLADVFGVRRRGVHPMAERIAAGEDKWKRQPFRLKGHAVTDGLLDSEIMTVPWFTIEPDGAEVLANWLEVRPGCDQGCVNMSREIIGEYDLPAFTVNTFGKGKAVYFNGDWFYDFAMRPIEYHWKLFRSLLQGVGALDVYSDAPKPIELTWMRQDEAGRTNLHLVNVVNSNRWYNALVFSRRYSTELGRSGKRSDFADAKEMAMAMKYRQKDTGDTSGPVDENLPVYGVPVYVKRELIDGKTVTINGQPAGELTDAGDGFVCITVPEVNVYSRITIED